MKVTSSIAILAAVCCACTVQLATAQDDRADRLRGDATSDRVRAERHTDFAPDWRRDGRHFRCGSVGMGHTSMHARYAVRGEHRLINFTASFETLDNRRFAAGDFLDVYLSSVSVGTMMLEERDRGVLVGRLELTSPTDLVAEQSDVDLARIRVGAGVGVVVGPLGCALDH